LIAARRTDVFLGVRGTRSRPPLADSAFMADPLARRIATTLPLLSNAPYASLSSDDCGSSVERTA